MRKWSTRNCCQSGLRDLGFEPFDYQPLPAQTAMFNAIEGLTDTCQRMAGFSLAGEAVATYLTQKMFASIHGARLDQTTLPKNYPG